MLKTFLSAICIAALATGSVAARPGSTQNQPPAPEKTASPPPRPPDPAHPVNVRIELTILDQTGPGEPAKKLVTMHVADRSNGSIRTSGWVLTKEGRRDVNINVDARPTLLRNREGAIQLDLGLQYQPTGLAAAATNTVAAAEAGSAQTGLTERIVTVLESGKAMISQASDPSMDRRISVEVKATIQK
jgi:hypothetical protein